MVPLYWRRWSWEAADLMGLRFLLVSVMVFPIRLGSTGCAEFCRLCFWLLIGVCLLFWVFKCLVWQYFRTAFLFLVCSESLLVLFHYETFGRELSLLLPWLCFFPLFFPCLCMVWFVTVMVLVLLWFWLGGFFELSCSLRCLGFKGSYF